MMEKTCLVKQCKGYPLYGFGFRSPIWACTEHRQNLTAAGASSAAVSAGGGKLGNAPPPALTSKVLASKPHDHKQGSLL
jgi:hypothetical protein